MSTHAESAVAPVDVEDTAAVDTGHEVVLAAHSAAASATTTTTTTALIPLVHRGNAHGMHTLGKCEGDCDEDAGVCPPTLASVCCLLSPVCARVFLNDAIMKHTASGVCSVHRAHCVKVRAQAKNAVQRNASAAHIKITD